MSHYLFDFILLVSSNPHDQHIAEHIAEILRSDGYVVATPWVIIASTWGKNMSEVLAMQIDQSERCIPLLSQQFLNESDTRYRYAVFEDRAEAAHNVLVLPFKIEPCSAGILEIMHSPLSLIGKDLLDMQGREWILDRVCWTISGRHPQSTIPRPLRGGLPLRPHITHQVSVGSNPAIAPSLSVSQPTRWCPNCGAAQRRDTARFCTYCGSSTSPQGASSSLTGMLDMQTLLHQRYRIIARIGQGGMGAVYKAEDISLQRPVAIKEMSQNTLKPDDLQNAMESFRNEALLLASLTHPNLPRIYEQFQEQGRHYLVMDFIEGETLETYLSRRQNHPLSVEEALPMGIQLCEVLDFLHTRQPPIIFRDLKPANVMHTDVGRLYLIDFGIARHFKPGQAKDTVAWGSSGYAPPEQYGREQTTARSDIYSLGAVLHQFLTGNDPAATPFRFPPLFLGQHQPLHELEELVLSMVALDTEKRPESAASVLRRLQDIKKRLAEPRQGSSQTRENTRRFRSDPPPFPGAPPKTNI